MISKTSKQTYSILQKVTITRCNSFKRGYLDFSQLTELSD